MQGQMSSDSINVLCGAEHQKGKDCARITNSSVKDSLGLHTLIRFFFLEKYLFSCVGGGGGRQKGQKKVLGLL